jgi:hypothetical protein
MNMIFAIFIECEMRHGDKAVPWQIKSYALLYRYPSRPYDSENARSIHHRFVRIEWLIGIAKERGSVTEPGKAQGGSRPLRVTLSIR